MVDSEAGGFRASDLPLDDEGAARDDAESPPPSRYAARIERLAQEARAAREQWAEEYLDDSDPVETALEDHDSAEQRALEAARDGLGPVVACYVEARTSDDPPRFSAREHRLLRQATRDWLECFARCHGVAHDSDATVRAAAELLLETHDVVAVAELLTGVPDG